MTYIPNDLYEIYYYKHDGSLYLTLTKWNRLEFSLRVNNPWNHTIELVLSIDDNLGNILRNLVRDYVIHIYRTDSISGARTLVYEGIHNTVYEQVRSDGNIYFGLYGSGYTKFLERRVVVPPTNTENVQKTGYAESIIKAFVNENLVSTQDIVITLGAGTTVKTYTVAKELRRLPGLVIAPDLQTGNTVEYTARFTKLDTVCQNLAKDGEVYYGIFGGSSIGEFIFDCRSVWGTDRRVDNTEGNTPYVFSLENNNMILPILSTNMRYEINFLYVAGAGQGTQRQIAVMSSPEDILESPWGLSEMYVDSRQAETEEGLAVVGQSTLKERGKLKTLEFEINQERLFKRWPEAWGLGDLVTAYYIGQRFDKRINEITVSINGSSTSEAQEQITVELEDV